ncbi:MAG TPA: rhomboid family intramembrane serine protease [Cyclobacteriaceae bacterium]
MNSILDDFKNAWNKPDNGLMQIILINLIIFISLIVLRVLMILSGFEDGYNFIITKLMLPASLNEFITQPWTIFTYFFTHEGFFHIIFNMLFLYWFGKLIVEYLGNDRAVSLYILGGLAGGLFYMLMYNLIPFYQTRIPGSLMLGASAGVYAIVVGAATFMPNYTFYLLLIGPVKIKYIAFFYVLLSFSQTIGSNAGGELAHLAGALIGYLFITQLRRGSDWGEPIINFLNYIKSFFIRQPKIKVTHRSKTPSKNAYSPRKEKKAAKTEQEEIDAILDKISQSGYESLTKEEKQKLFNASKNG